MAVGRLIPESNPANKQQPGIMPQHVLPGTEDTRLTEGSDGALHNKIVDVNGNPISSGNRLPVTANTQVGGADVSDSNPMPTQLTGRKVKVHYRENIQTSTVTAGSNQIVDLFSAAGWKEKTLWMPLIDILPPPSATSGTHSFVIQPNWGGAGMVIEAAYNSSILLLDGVLKSGSYRTTIGDEFALQWWNTLMFDAGVGLRLQYMNLTDVDQTNSREVKFITEREGVV